MRLLYGSQRQQETCQTCSTTHSGLCQFEFDLESSNRTSREPQLGSDGRRYEAEELSDGLGKLLKSREALQYLWVIADEVGPGYICILLQCISCPLPEQDDKTSQLVPGIADTPYQSVDSRLRVSASNLSRPSLTYCPWMGDRLPSPCPRR